MVDIKTFIHTALFRLPTKIFSAACQVLAILAALYPDKVRSWIGYEVSAERVRLLAILCAVLFFFYWFLLLALRRATELRPKAPENSFSGSNEGVVNQATSIVYHAAPEAAPKAVIKDDYLNLQIEGPKYDNSMRPEPKYELFFENRGSSPYRIRGVFLWVFKLEGPGQEFNLKNLAHPEMFQAGRTARDWGWEAGAAAGQIPLSLYKPATSSLDSFPGDGSGFVLKPGESKVMSLKFDIKRIETEVGEFYFSPVVIVLNSQGIRTEVWVPLHRYYKDKDWQLILETGSHNINLSEWVQPF